MRERVDKLGVGEQEIRKQDPDQIVVALPGVKDPGAAADIIGKTAQLELYDLQKNLVSPSRDGQGFPVATGHDLQPPRGPAVEDSRTTRRTPGTSSTTRRSSSPGLCRAARPRSTRRRSSRFDGKLPKSWRLFGVPAEHGRDQVPARRPLPERRPGHRLPQRLFYLMRFDPDERGEPRSGDDRRATSTSTARGRTSTRARTSRSC